jgi:hypothetical protein
MVKGFEVFFGKFRKYTDCFPSIPGYIRYMDGQAAHSTTKIKYSVKSPEVVLRIREGEISKQHPESVVGLRLVFT